MLGGNTRSVLYNNPFPLAVEWAILATSVGTAIIAVLGLPANADVKPELFDGVLESVDYWRDEPLILSAEMGFDNVLGEAGMVDEVVIMSLH